MHITVLSDNNGTESLAGEWGLSILIEHDGLRILLDAGSSDLALKNAAALGKDLQNLDFAVLSHAHYDHADGFVPLLRENPALKVYVRMSVLNDCYAQKENGMEYIGVAPALIDDFERRLVRVDGDCEIAENSIGTLWDGFLRSMLVPTVMKDGVLFVAVRWFAEVIFGMHVTQCDDALYISDHHGEMSKDMAYIIREILS